MTYQLPHGYTEVDTHPEQIVFSGDEARQLAGFSPVIPEGIPADFVLQSMAVETDHRIIKLQYGTLDGSKAFTLLQREALQAFKPVPRATLGKMGDRIVEIQLPLQGREGVLSGGGAAVAAEANSIRWIEEGFEFAVIGTQGIKDLASLAQDITGTVLEIPMGSGEFTFNPKVVVPYDIETVKNEQRSVDEGHSPWKLDPAFVSQVFVGLKLSPGGIQGDYPIAYEAFKVVSNNSSQAIVEVQSDKSPVARVYLKRLIRQDLTGIWTVVGYDPVS
ncbi:MAG: hypothetical protein N2376_11500 [Clostridia bacterium]|nr:hypothetical protein [Clostridia bacterium]